MTEAVEIVLEQRFFIELIQHRWINQAENGSIVARDVHDLLYVLICKVSIPCDNTKLKEAGVSMCILLCPILSNHLDNIGHLVNEFLAQLPIVSDLVMVDENVELLVVHFNVRGLVIKLYR